MASHSAEPAIGGIYEGESRLMDKQDVEDCGMLLSIDRQNLTDGSV